MDCNWSLFLFLCQQLEWTWRSLRWGKTGLLTLSFVCSLAVASLELKKVSSFCFPHSYNIDQHDYSVRMRAARKFLQDGDKVVPIYFLCWSWTIRSDYIFLMCGQVKVIVNMKGRENEFRNIAIELLRRFQTEIGEVCMYCSLHSLVFSNTKSSIGFWHVLCSLVKLVNMCSLRLRKVRTFGTETCLLSWCQTRKLFGKHKNHPLKRRKSQLMMKFQLQV